MGAYLVDWVDDVAFEVAFGIVAVEYADCGWGVIVM